MRKRQAKVTGAAGTERRCESRVDMRQRVAALLRFGWQASHGMGGRLWRFTQEFPEPYEFAPHAGHIAVFLGDFGLMWRVDL